MRRPATLEVETTALETVGPVREAAITIYVANVPIYSTRVKVPPTMTHVKHNPRPEEKDAMSEEHELQQLALAEWAARLAPGTTPTVPTTKTSTAR